MTGRRPAPLVAPIDLARFLLAVGLAPLLLVLDRPPWSFTLTPDWSVQQLAVIAIAGVGLGLLPGRPAQGLAAVGFGSLTGLAFDLWWLAGWVKPYDQDFVTTIAVDAWRQSLISAGSALVGVLWAGFLVGAIVARVVRGGALPERRRPTRAEATAAGLAVIGAPLLVAGLAMMAGSSGARHARRRPDPVGLDLARGDRAGSALAQTWPDALPCHVAPDAIPEWARLIARPDGHIRRIDHRRRSRTSLPVRRTNPGP